MALISRLYNQIIELFRILAGVVVFGIFLLIVSDVLLRIFSLPLWTYSSGVVEYGLLWFTMLAAPWLVRIKGHVFIDAVTQLLPGGIDPPALQGGHSPVFGMPCRMDPVPSLKRIGIL